MLAGSAQDGLKDGMGQSGSGRWAVWLPPLMVGNQPVRSLEADAVGPGWASQVQSISLFLQVGHITVPQLQKLAPVFGFLRPAGTFIDNTSCWRTHLGSQMHRGNCQRVIPCFMLYASLALSIPFPARWARVQSSHLTFDSAVPEVGQHE